MIPIVVCQDLDDLGAKVAAEFVSLAVNFVQASGKFTVCLAGGNTPKAFYALLAAGACAVKIPWEQCHFFWGDERCVAPDHADSNYRMAREALLSKVPVPENQIYRIMAEKPPDLAAARYEATLKAHFNSRAGDFPRFHLVFLGLGEDGHTASLFPDSEAVEEQNRCVVAPYVKSLKARRLSLTLPVFNRAANVFFLVSGSSKAEILARIMQPPESSKPLPAQRIRPQNGRLVWFVDQAAARNLSLDPSLASRSLFPG